jgi:acetyl-CoA synthetase
MMLDLALTRPGRDAAPRLVDYERERSTFHLEAPERYNPVLAIVESWAREEPVAPAVLSLDPTGATAGVHTVGELAAASRRTARALLNAGIGKGDRVFIMLPQVHQWYSAMLGAMRIGAVPMPGPTLLTAKDIRQRLLKAGAKAAVTDVSGSDKVQAAGVRLRARWCVGEAPPCWLDFDAACEEAGDGDTPQDPTHRDDPLLLYFTSGTVSAPKMVTHRQDHALAHVATARFWHDLRAGDVHWTVTDTGWAKAAYGSLFGQFHERASVVQAPLGRATPDAVLSILANVGITSFCAPPTLYRSLVQADFAPFDLEALRHCCSAGEPLNPEVIREWQNKTGLTIYDAYGQTETTLLVANYRAVPVRPGSMGKPVPGWDVEVVDDGGKPVAPGVVGNVVVNHGQRRQPGLFPGYYEDSEATEAVFRGPHYFTGDRATKDQDGYFWFVGRNDDVITSSAYRIGPFEVESALIEHPAVMESAVVGRPDAGRTEIVVAICILAPGYEASSELARELQEFVRSQTAPYKYPREVHFVDELPKTVSGKIRRSELRQWLLDGRLPPEAASS